MSKAAWTWLGYRCWLVALTKNERYADCPRTTGDRRYRIVSHKRQAGGRPWGAA